MKYLTNRLIVLLIVVSTYSQAQIQKGVYSIRGSASYSKNEMQYSSFTAKSTSFSLSPALTYFLTNNVELNWSLNYTDTESSGPYFNYSNTFTTVSAGFRLYYPIEEIALFGGASVGKADGIIKISYSIEGGLDYFIFSNIALEPVMIYSNEETSPFKSVVTKFYVGFRYFML